MLTGAQCLKVILQFLGMAKQRPGKQGNTNSLDLLKLTWLT
uniref:Uncharacterized protein n=1 Tax=Anguilla anguilla TaxID=7936 RepID=A0A0E9U3B0_ANGAN